MDGNSPSASRRLVECRGCDAVLRVPTNGEGWIRCRKCKRRTWAPREGRSTVTRMLLSVVHNSSLVLGSALVALIALACYASVAFGHRSFSLLATVVASSASVVLGALLNRRFGAE